MTTPNTPQELFDAIYRDRNIQKICREGSKAPEIIHTIRDRRLSVRELMEVVFAITYMLVNHAEYLKAKGEQENAFEVKMCGAETMNAAVGIRAWVQTLFRAMDERGR